MALSASMLNQLGGLYGSLQAQLPTPVPTPDEYMLQMMAQEQQRAYNRSPPSWLVKPVMKPKTFREELQDETDAWLK